MADDTHDTHPAGVPDPTRTADEGAAHVGFIPLTGDPLCDVVACVILASYADGTAIGSQALSALAARADGHAGLAEAVRRAEETDWRALRPWFLATYTAGDAATRTRITDEMGRVDELWFYQGRTQAEHLAAHPTGDCSPPEIIPAAYRIDDDDPRVHLAARMHFLREDSSGGRANPNLPALYGALDACAGMFPTGLLVMIRRNADLFDGRYNDGRIFRSGGASRMRIPAALDLVADAETALADLEAEEGEWGYAGTWYELEECLTAPTLERLSAIRNDQRDWCDGLHRCHLPRPETAPER